MLEDVLWGWEHHTLTIVSGNSPPVMHWVAPAVPVAKV